MLYPALHIQASDRELLYAALDDYSPRAIEDRDDGVLAFFASSAVRDAALAALRLRYHVRAVDVPDDDWARRSQQNLSPVTIGRITVYPDPLSAAHYRFASASTDSESQLPSPPSAANPESRLPNPDAIAIVIAPSMGFGTGHHATTRLCLAALQQIDLRGRTVLDVGTGSGVLAIAAARLGAARVFGVDYDPDALQSARDNLNLNRDTEHITFVLADVASATLPPADVVTANLTGALLVRAADSLCASTAQHGTLVLSGLMSHERDAVVTAFPDTTVIGERHEDEWVCLTMKKA